MLLERLGLFNIKYKLSSGQMFLCDFFFFETRSYVFQGGLELVIWLLNLLFTLLPLFLGARIMVVDHQTRL